MKKLLMIAVAVFALTACSDKKAGKKEVFDDLMKVHEKVMNADEQLVKNKADLDSLLKQSGTAAKDSLILLSRKCAAADSAMENWMHQFKSDFEGKTEDETVNYLNDQKKQIAKIDSAISAAVEQSTKLLQETKKK